MIVINKSVKNKKKDTRQQLRFQIFLRLENTETPKGRPGFSVTFGLHKLLPNH